MERISRLVEFYDKNGQFSGTILVAQDGTTIYEARMLSVGRTWSGVYPLGCPIDFPYENGPLTAVGLSGAIISFNSSIRRLTGGNGVQFIAILSDYNNPEGVQIWPVYSETIARQIAAIMNGLEYEPPTISAASVVGRTVLESGGDVVSTTVPDL